MKISTRLKVSSSNCKKSFLLRSFDVNYLYWNSLLKSKKISRYLVRNLTVLNIILFYFFFVFLKSHEIHKFTRFWRILFNTVSKNLKTVLKLKVGKRKSSSFKLQMTFTFKYIFAFN